jgi:hypothetical protein
MLAGVLLHVIETARPVNAAVDSVRGDFLVDDVGDFLAIIADVENVGFGKLAQIVGLAAGSWIEKGAIEENLPGAFCSRRANERFGRGAGMHGGGEVLQEGVVVIEAASGHESGILAQPKLVFTGTAFGWVSVGVPVRIELLERRRKRKKKD